MGQKKSTMQKVKESQPEIFSELIGLSRRFGADVFRIGAGRYFKRQVAEERLQEEIAFREKELAALRNKGKR